MQVHRVAAAEAEQPPDQVLVAVRPGEAGPALLAVLSEDATDGALSRACGLGGRASGEPGTVVGKPPVEAQTGRREVGR